MAFEEAVWPLGGELNPMRQAEETVGWLATVVSCIAG